MMITSHINWLGLCGKLGLDFSRIANERNGFYSMNSKHARDGFTAIWYKNLRKVWRNYDGEV